MKPRLVVIKNAHTLSNSETEETNIEIKDPISAITIQVSATNGSVSNKANFIHDIITKIELVEGSTVLHSVNMAEELALQFYNTRGKQLLIRPSEWANGSQVEAITLFFGRYLWDKIYAFDATKHSNPQLKVTINLGAVRAVGTNAFVSGSGLITIIAHVMDGLETKPAGFILTKQIKSWTTAASGDEPCDLPTDFPIKAILFRSYEAGTDVDEALTKLKLTINEGERIPFEIDGNDLWEENIQKFGELVYRHDFLTQGSQTLTLLVNHDPVCAYKSNSEGRIFWSQWEWSSQAYIMIETDAGVAVATDEQVRSLIRGSSPFATLFHEFGDPNDPADYLKLEPTDNAKIIITQGNVGGAATVVIQQLRPYA